MFTLLTRVLLWLLIGVVVYSLFQRFFPKGSFLARLIVVILLVVVALAFLNPNEPAVASLWRVISFPLKPLGASILLLIMAAQNMKGGGELGKPGAYLVGWALTILLLASTPAIAYFLVRAPLVATIPGEESVQNFNLASSGTLLAMGQTIPTSDIAGNSILPMNVASTSYLLQNPQNIGRRGLRLDDFVPSAETLQVTTRAWERYLNSVYYFLRPRRR